MASVGHLSVRLGHCKSATPQPSDPAKQAQVPITRLARYHRCFSPSPLPIPTMEKIAEDMVKIQHGASCPCSHAWYMAGREGGICMYISGCIVTQCIRVPPLYGQFYGIVQKEFVANHSSLLGWENNYSSAQSGSALELSNHRKWVFVHCVLRASTLTTASRG